MLNFYCIWRIALNEAKLLFRSWGFRIFSLLGLIILTLLTVGIGTTVISTPYFLSSLSGSLPLATIKLFNIYQGIIAAFLATEFFKRDRRHDSNQVVLASSFSNMEYFLGKVVGILSVFALLNAVVLLITFVIHFFFSGTLFAWQPYILYSLLISLPTLIFLIGLSFLLSALLRSQAVAFVLMLGYSLLVLVIIGPHLFNLFDSYAFYQPLIYSDFIGLGNVQPLLLIRSVYLLLGLSFIAATVLLTKRLRQSVMHNIGAGVFMIFCLLLAVVFGHSFIKGKLADREYRHLLKASSNAVSDIPTATMTNCDISLHHEGDEIEATAKLVLTNSSTTPVDKIILTLNPGLTVNQVSGNKGELNFQRINHILQIIPASPVKPAELINLTILYSGSIDENYCYLDISNSHFESLHQLWIYNIPKRYAFISSDFLHLTPESGWYPVSGLPPGAAFPSEITRDYTEYTLSVTVPKGKKAISQGLLEINTQDNQDNYTFKPKMPLPQISLTIGNYDQRNIEVDGIIYSLFSLPGHDYFTPCFNEMGDIFPDTIRYLKNEYEVGLGMEYPFSKLSLIEVPIQFYSYERMWTVGQDMVQPQLVFLPEMGTICGSADFPVWYRNVRRKIGKKGSAITEKDIQKYNFERFVRTDLLGTQAGSSNVIWVPRVRIKTMVEVDTKPNFEIFPNYISYQTYLSSSSCPILNYALETYFHGDTSSSTRMFEREWGRGLSEAEQTSLILKEISLSNLVKEQSQRVSSLSTALKIKGRHLFSFLEAKLGEENFKIKLYDFFKNFRFSKITEDQFESFISTLGDIDLKTYINSWYHDKILPGYIIEGLNSYQVIEREHTKTQVKFKITNPTEIEGLIKLSFLYRGGNKRYNMVKGGGGLQSQSDYSRLMMIPAKTTKDVGIIIDQPPSIMIIDTFVSQNIPSVITFPFWKQNVKRGQQAVEGESSSPYVELLPGTDGEFLVDNEDMGFEIVSGAKESWLQRTLNNLSGKSDEKETYSFMNTWDPPKIWVLTTNENFFGKFVRSGFIKKSENGESKAAWSVEIKEPGNYDIFFHHEGVSQKVNRSKNEKAKRSSGKKQFMIFHDDGVEEINFDLKNAEIGWNHLGTYHLSSGEKRIELTDKNDLSYVTADAIKWVRRKN